MLKYRVITGKNGSILGKIRVNPMSEPRDHAGYAGSSNTRSSRTNINSNSRNHNSGSARSTSDVIRRDSQAERAAIRHEIFYTEPVSMERTHRDIQTQAIRAYHDHALSTRTAEHAAEIRRARERRQAAQPVEQTRGSDPARSDVSASSNAHSSSETDEPRSGSSRRKTDRATEHYNPKYLVRGLLKFASRSSRSSSKSKDGGRKLCSDHDSFFPTPKITFLIDQPENLTCLICSTSLKMCLNSEEAKETTPAILACGHLACSSCLTQWLKIHGNCPFCRQEMTYSSCGHDVEPRLIAHDTIHSIPRTLADGGKIGKKCGSCRAKAQRKESLEKWQELADEYKTAREEAERLKTDSAIQAMKKAQRAFERLPFDHSYDALSWSIGTW
ncbi:hypothetical protein F4810DRAFT_677660 [Camillea tinctor]|nr:hypothetical protein F4810DRAFT_677660 [Camillea tinctor]